MNLERVAVAWHGEKAHHLVLTPKPISLLIDSADPIWCPDSDLLGQSRLKDGDGDGKATCDRGAVEFTGSILQTGGISGFCYNSKNDGHYVLVLENPHNVLVIWNTFDRLGQQAWVYSTGNLQKDGYFEADAYINPEGRLSDHGPIDITRAKFWGKIQMQFDSCIKGHFSFESPDPIFGSGDFAIERLAFVKQLGCVD